MHSRTIATIVASLLVGLIACGSVAIHLTLSAAMALPAPADVPPGFTRPAPDTALTAVLPAFTTPPAQASRPHPPTVDSLRQLLAHAHARFAPHSAEVTNEMIPLLARIIQVLNARSSLVVHMEITDPDAALARARARTINEVLRLNVTNPGNLHLTGLEGSPGTRVY